MIKMLNNRMRWHRRRSDYDSKNLELVTIPCFLPFTKRVLLRNLIEQASVPEEIRSLLCLSRIDSTFLACGDISGLIEILGR